MARKRPKTYEATVGGRKVRVTVPEDDPAEPSKELRDLLEDCLSPQAVAALANAVRVQANTIEGRGGPEHVCREFKWFAGEALSLVGNAYELLCKEAGL